MEVEIYTIKEKIRYVNVQKVELLERTILVEREDEDKIFIHPLINIYQVAVEGAIRLSTEDEKFVLGPRDETQ